MTNTLDTPTSGSAPGMDTGSLPAMPVRELPAPPAWRKLVGPGIVLAAVGLGSGEYILHPFITSQVGLTFVWAAALGLGLQYFVNTEIVRYTFTTGETILTGFMRKWRLWGPLFIAMTVLPFAWPAWMTSAATLITFPAGGGDVTMIAIGGLVLIGLVLTLSPVVYHTVERLELGKVALVLLFAVLAVVALIGWQPWVELPQDTVSGFGRLPEGVPTGVLISAMVFAGGGGAVNIAVSNWARDKGWGMGAHAPRIVSPVTGHEEAGTATGFQFEVNDENLGRWQAWWKAVRLEQFLTFVVVTLVAVVVFALLAFSAFGEGGWDGPADLTFIQQEGVILGQMHGDWVKMLFWIVGAVSLMFANLVVVDLVGRITSNILATYTSVKGGWSEAKFYVAIVWAVVALGIIILLAGVDQPFTLLSISAILNAVVMVVYSGLIVQVNRSLHPSLSIGRGRTAAMVTVGVAYAAFASYTIYVWVSAW